MNRRTTILLVCFLALATVASAQTAPDGFLDIPWGTSKSQTKSMMLKRTGTTYDSKNSTDVTMIFDHGSFSGYAVYFYLLSFNTSGELSRGTAIFQQADEDETNTLFENLLTKLSSKYGTPDVTEIEDEDDSRFAKWMFSGGFSVSLHITELAGDNHVKVVYTDSERWVRKSGSDDL